MLNQNIRMGVYDIIIELNLSQNAGAYIIWSERGEENQEGSKVFFPLP